MSITEIVILILVAAVAILLGLNVWNSAARKKLSGQLTNSNTKDQSDVLTTQANADTAQINQDQQNLTKEEQDAANEPAADFWKGKL